MDRPLPPQTEHPTAVPTVGSVPLNLLLGCSPRECREPLAATPNRRTLPGSPVLRQSEDGRRTRDQSQTRSTTDAPDGHRGSLRQTEPEPSGSWPSHLPVPSARAADRAGSPSVEHRYHLHSATAGFPVSGGHRGLVQPLRLELGAFQHVGCPFCSAALAAALDQYGRPEIWNSDQGSQFTSTAFLAPLLALEVAISMDGRGRALDNVFIERVWRSLKYELIYPGDFGSGEELREALIKYWRFYNHERPHQALGYATPADLFGNGARR